MEVLARGAEAWNAWRRENVGVSLDLEGFGFDAAGPARLFNPVVLASADLSGANLSRAFLNGANLAQANLRGANLRGTTLFLANLFNADLSRSNLSGAHVNGALFLYTILTDAQFGRAIMGRTVFVDVDLSTVKGLDTIQHQTPSTIGIDTIYRSQGKIPDSFLRGAGVPENLITYMKSLTGAAFDFYSCFISYSSKDQDFAERLHADLQGKGVRCWFAPEDLKIGDKFRSCIDESIRIHDKLLLVLSRNSIGSAWVEKEVETAFERERQEKRTVLFPIRLDDDVMETSESWAADIRRTRHIGDMTGWKDHPAYAKSFERLLRDLKAAQGANSKTDPQRGVLRPVPGLRIIAA